MNDMLDYHYAEGVAEIRLHNGKVNAFSPAFIEAIDEALSRAEQEDAAVLFVGNPGIFSAGFDLKVVKSGDQQAIADMLVAGGHLCARMLAYPRPIVAAVTGHCMAQGVMFLLACDYTVATAGEFTLGLNETQIGMVMPQYGVVLAQGRFPQQVLQRVVTHAELYDPQGALALGLLDQVVDSEQLLAVARTETRRLADLDKRAFKGNKQRMRQPQVDAIQAALVQDAADILAGIAG